ncbi:DEAD/DEAH box helicase [Sinomonas humi]|uniref:DEAD/DEAH box helicase n=1 Tax=Sinomonas humi TaxID=1338436 RepID=UPI0018CDA9A1|nr:DEAD/DEAH box helicase [Sinomonas humi]
MLGVDDVTLSQCVWAVGRFRQRNLLDDVLADFTADETRWARQLGDLVVARGIRAGDESASGFHTRPLSHADLRAILDLGLNETGAEGLLKYRGEELTAVRVESREIRPRRDGEDPEPKFLNSFFFADLLSISKTHRRGGAMRQYLGLNPTGQRIDLREDLAAVYDSVAPNMLPDGRWPSDIGHPLALSQQFAVNRALADLEGAEGLFAVNGPPGTGKTTMLRDMIAALVTKRATALASFAHAGSAFVETSEIGTRSGIRSKVHRLHESLRGFEMVIASSNNGAVENISLEIPALSKDVIGPTFCATARYFPEIATRLLNEKNSNRDDDSPKQAWALVSAKLGNSSNVGAFINTALFGDKRWPDAADAVPGLFQQLNHPPANALSWPEARKSFLKAKSEVDRLRTVRQRLHDAFLHLPRRRQETQHLERALEVDCTQLKEQERLVSRQEESLAELAGSEAADRSDLAAHLAARPGVLEQIFSFGRVMTGWRRRQVNLAERVDRAGAEAAILKATIDQSRRVASSLRERRDETFGRLQDRKRQVAMMESALSRYTHEGPPADWFEVGSIEREKAAPWLDKEFNESRSRLFLEALQLHRAFVFDQNEKMRQNLSAACNVLKKSIAPDTPSRAVREAWEALFMVVPTITTTFASMPRLFASLKDEQLGWLFIDEAGQAPPQAAACGIWRTRRALLVGDPLQLTPVVTLPSEYQNRLLEITGTDSHWLPGTNPAQVLADRTAKYGTNIQPAGRDKIWVGAPLRVHRRCDNPMFDTVNYEVYDGLMIHGGKTMLRRFPEEEHRQEAPKSSWLDVTTIEWNGHASAQELIRFDELLRSLMEAGHDMSKVLAISPFRQTAFELERRAKRYLRESKTQSGTVHRAQGKEADIVILVLGGKTSRARNWAVDTPNLFNVAVSRAKHRLYVIGNRGEWAKLPYFKAISLQLDHHPPHLRVGDLFAPTPRLREAKQPDGLTVARMRPDLETQPEPIPRAEGGPSERPRPPIFDDNGHPVSRAEYWGQQELSSELGIPAPRVGDLLRETGLLLPGPDKEPSPEALEQGLAVWVTVMTAGGPRRYARWQPNRTLEILEPALGLDET